VCETDVFKLKSGPFGVWYFLGVDCSHPAIICLVGIDYATA